MPVAIDPTSLMRLGAWWSRVRSRRTTTCGLAGVGFLMAMSGVAVATTQGTQGSSRTDGVIAGRVVDGTTGHPVAGATVRLGTVNMDVVAAATERLARRLDRTIRPPTLPTRTTDLDGRFEFAGLPAGRYWGVVAADGFTSNDLGDRKVQFDAGVGAPLIDLRPGERLEDLPTKIWRAGSIRGVITDEKGEPIVNATVQSFRRQYVGGRAVWSRHGAARTDDRGAFQLVDLWPGTYVVALVADVKAGRQRAVFYGGSLTADAATAIVLAPGERREGIDLVHTFVRENQAASLSVSGQVLGDVAMPGKLITLHLVPDNATDSAVPLEELTAVADARGAFSFPKAPPGEYHLQAWRFPALEARVMGSVNIVPTGNATAPRFATASTWAANQPLSPG